MHLSKAFLLLSLIAATLSSSAAHAQDSSPLTHEAILIGTLVTDRPDQTESSAVIPAGYVQVEMGWTHSENDDSGVKVRLNSLPETLIRIGVCKNLELRLSFDGLQSQVTNTDSPVAKIHQSGAGDTAFGLKYYLIEEQGLRPEMALLGNLSLATGESDFSSRHSDPSFRLCCSHSLKNGLSVGYNIGVAWQSEEDAAGERHSLSVAQWTAVVGRSLSDKAGVFVEIFGEAGLSAQGGPKNSIDAGVTYLLQDNFQVDTSFGVGLTEDADDWFFGMGLSYRFPH